MEFRCEDLRDVGVLLLPYRRDDPLGAVLLNQSSKPIAAWSLTYKFEDRLGRASGFHRRMTPWFPSLLLPFGLSDEARRLDIYWRTIFPGSKRYISEGEMIGDNTDIRPPAPEEEWKGCSFSMSSSHAFPSAGKLKSATLILDGIFFSDGEFAGPNDLQLYELIVYDAEVYQEVGQIVRDQVRKSASTGEILDAVEKLTAPVRTRGPAPPPLHPANKYDADVLRDHARANIAHQLSRLLEMHGDQMLVVILNRWADAEVPDFRRQ